MTTLVKKDTDYSMAKHHKSACGNPFSQIVNLSLAFVSLPDFIATLYASRPNVIVFNKFSPPFKGSLVDMNIFLGIQRNSKCRVQNLKLNSYAKSSTSQLALSIVNLILIDRASGCPIICFYLILRSRPPPYLNSKI